MFQQKIKAVTEEKNKGSLEVLTFLGVGTEFKGKVIFQGTLRIDGKVEGEIDGNNTLLVGESGIVNGTIKAANILISGKVRGDLRAFEKITLKKGCEVKGTIFSKAIIIEEGAIFNGTCKMEEGVEREPIEEKEEEKAIIRI